MDGTLDEQIQGELAANPNLAQGINTAAHDVQKYNWNMFRYIADYLHLFGILFLIFALYKKGNCRGLSLKTQVLYFIIFVSRYLDLFDHSQATYLVLFKLTYISATLVTLIIFYNYQKKDQYSYEIQKDTSSMPAMIIPCFIAALILPKEKSFLEIFWAFSEYLEGFSMVPQYTFCYRESLAAFEREKVVIIYIMAIGGYRVFYAFNWMYKRWNVPGYSDLQSWIGGFIEILFFIDFLSYFVFQKFSFLRAAVLNVDDKVNEVVDKVQVELKVMTKEDAEERGNLRRRGGGIGRTADEYDGVPTNDMNEEV